MLTGPTNVFVALPYALTVRAESVDVTVDEAARKPPKRERVFVVSAPLLVMIWRVAVVAASPGQFVPFARHTLDPPREMLPPVIVTLPEVKLVVLRFVPEAEVK